MTDAQVDHGGCELVRASICVTSDRKDSAASIALRKTLLVEKTSMPVEWNTNMVSVLAQAKSREESVLISVSGAPVCVGSAKLDTEVYMNDGLSWFIHHHFIPLRISTRESVAEAERLGAFWTPTAIMLDSTGVERYRIEGYLPPKEFAAHIVLGLGRISFMQKQWQAAEDFYARVITRHTGSKAVAEARYWAAVCCYKKTKDIRVLTEVSHFNPDYKDSIWAMKTSVWAEMK